MAISVKFQRLGSNTNQNTFVVTAGSGDSGKLQIQYNGSDIYNNLSGSVSDIVSGASNNTIYIPLDTNNKIPKGVYYFNFVADVGSSGTNDISFQIDSIAPAITSDVDVYAPTFLTQDDTNYTIANGTVTSASRSITAQYPTGSEQSNLVETATDVTSTLYISTANVWTGAMQTYLSYDITYTIAATGTYDSFVYQEIGNGSYGLVINPENLLSDVYDCIENLRQQVNNAATLQRSNYQSLLSNYTYACSLAIQFREAVSAAKTSALDEIISKIKALTNCQGSTATATSSQTRKIYGIANSSESIEDIVGAMLEQGTSYGLVIDYNDAADVVDFQVVGTYLTVFNNTGSQLTSGKAVYLSGYNTSEGLSEVSLASNLSASSANAIGLVYENISDQDSGKVLLHGNFEEINTNAFTLNDKLYLSTSGNITNSEPSTAEYKQFIGTVSKVGTAGKVLVSPEQPVNFDGLLNNSAIISVIENNMVVVKVSLLAGQFSTLNTLPLTAVTGAANQAYFLHSGAVYFSTAPSGASSPLDVAIFGNTSAAFSSSSIIASAAIDVNIIAGQYVPLQIFTSSGNNELTLGQNLYIGSGANDSGWASAIGYVVLMYSQQRPY